MMVQQQKVQTLRHGQFFRISLPLPWIYSLEKSYSPLSYRNLQLEDRTKEKRFSVNTVQYTETVEYKVDSLNYSKYNFLYLSRQL